MLTVAQAAEVLGVSPRRVRALLVQGRIVGAVKLGRDWRIAEPLRMRRAGLRGPRMKGAPLAARKDEA